MHPARTALTIVAAAASAGGLGFVASPAAQAAGDTGAVYVLSNQAAGNAVLAYTRSADGTLNFDDSYPTTGTGTGGGLGSQGAVVVDDAEAHLYAVDAGGSGNVTAPGEVSFTPDGSRLLVTERATSLTDVFTLDGTGRPVDLASYPSSG